MRTHRRRRLREPLDTFAGQRPNAGTTEVHQMDEFSQEEVNHVKVNSVVRAVGNVQVDQLKSVLREEA